MDEGDVKWLVRLSAHVLPEEFRQAYEEALRLAAVRREELPPKVCIEVFGRENHAMAMPAFLYSETGWIVVSRDWISEKPSHEQRLRAFLHEIAALHLNWSKDRLQPNPEICLVPHDHREIEALVDEWLTVSARSDGTLDVRKE